MNSENKKSFIHSECKREDKARWVRAAISENLKLTAWINKTLNASVKQQVKENDK